MTVQAGCKIKNLPTRFVYQQNKKGIFHKKNKKGIRIQVIGGKKEEDRFKKPIS